MKHNLHHSPGSAVLSRRSLITRCGMLAAVGGMGATAFLSDLQAAETEPKRLSFDWTKPEDNLTGLVKVMGDLSGEGRWWSAQGTIYARQPGIMTRPILKVEGARFIRFDKIDGGYSMYSRDWAVFRDHKTGAVIDEYDNPITGKRNRVAPILTRGVAWDMKPETGQYLPGYTGEGWLIGKPLIMPWVEEGNHVAVTLELLVKYGNGVVGSEMEHFLANRDELYDPDLTSVKTARQAWIGNSPWLRWMEMGDRPGGTQWHSTGLKHLSHNDLRPEFRDAIDRYFPGSLEAPASYKKPKARE